MSLQGVSIHARESGLKYLPDLVLVEQILPDGSVAYPHTDQLAAISKAVDREFFEALPNRIATTDHRGDGQRKWILHNFANRYCDFKNELRDDRLILCPAVRRDLVTRVAVVQHITLHGTRGKYHRFRFFADGAFFPDLLFCNTPFYFTTHAVERYRDRVGHTGRVPWSSLLMWTLNNFGHLLKANGRERAVVFRHPSDSIIAFTIELTTGGFIFTTCLTAGEIDSLEHGEFSVPQWFHFGPIEGGYRLNWNYKLAADKLIELWKTNAQPSIPLSRINHPDPARLTWHFMAHQCWENGERFKMPPGMEFAFAGNFHTSACLHWPAHLGKPHSPDDPPVPLVQKKKPADSLQTLENIAPEAFQQLEARAHETPPA